jgi:hypothetical protein
MKTSVHYLCYFFENLNIYTISSNMIFLFYHDDKYIGIR